MAENHVLKIECADQKGLVHRITGVLFEEGLNIVENGEFVDAETKRFFMRTEVAGKVDTRQILDKLRRKLPADAVVEIGKNKKKDIVVFATNEPHCLGDLLMRHAYGELHANILAIISNHSALEKLAERFKVAYHHIPSENRKREGHEKAVLKVLSRYKLDYLVLAKYMRILSPRFVNHFRNRVINIHHSFLPAFAGASPYEQAAKRGVKIIGATAHFVNEELDKGPIIAQDILRVDHSQSAMEMAQAGRDVEKIVLAKALKLAFEGRIFVSGNRTIIFD